MKIHVSKKRWYFAILNVFFVILAVFFAIIFSVISHKLDSIHAADRWRGENNMRFAQISCFLPVDSPKKQEDILQFRHTLTQKLVAASLDPADGTNLFVDSYSGEAKMTVIGEHGKADVKAIGVGGNFFLFHPLQVLSGNYISDSDFMQDRVVLDEALAWQLFGSSDVAGMTVHVGETPLYVAGVVRRESDYASREAFGSTPCMFLSFSAFHALTEGGISCYEIVMPDMISGFAMNIMRENFTIGSGHMVENSRRYSFSSLLKVAGDYGVRSMRHNGVIYPYWENAVRMTEDHLALLLVLILLLSACPAVTLVVLGIKMLIHLYRTVTKKLPEKAVSARERRREAQYARIGEKK